MPPWPWPRPPVCAGPSGDSQGTGSDLGKWRAWEISSGVGLLQLASVGAGLSWFYLVQPDSLQTQEAEERWHAGSPS